MILSITFGLRNMIIMRRKSFVQTEELKYHVSEEGEGEEGKTI